LYKIIYSGFSWYKGVISFNIPDDGGGKKRWSKAEREKKKTYYVCVLYRIWSCLCSV